MGKGGLSKEKRTIDYFLDRLIGDSIYTWPKEKEEFLTLLSSKKAHDTPNYNQWVFSLGATFKFNASFNFITPYNPKADYLKLNENELKLFWTTYKEFFGNVSDVDVDFLVGMKERAIFDFAWKFIAYRR